jgi:tubulin monoglycylase TTLL3/8
MYYAEHGKKAWDTIPLTFHIKSGIHDHDFKEFKDTFESYQTEKNQSVWIIKPGENTNRGNGITVCDSIQEISKIISEDTTMEAEDRSYIIQKYIENPMLYNKRKFDIRVYMLITSINGIQKAYWYQEGYIRTSSYEYDNSNLLEKMIHLTNDAVQKNCQEYGKYEAGNKVSFTEFQKYIDTNHPDKHWNFDEPYTKMKKMALDIILAVYGRLDETRRNFSFELFGLDFMIDQNFKPWLIEVNTNPCIELSAPLLAKLIPGMLENMFKLVIDPLFPPPIEWPQSRRNLIPENCVDQNKWDLIFDEREFLK